MIVRNASGGGGVKLPVLTNPAAAAQVLKGYEFIDPATGEAAAGTFDGYAVALGTAGTVEKGASVSFNCPGSIEVVAISAFNSNAAVTPSTAANTIHGVMLAKSTAINIANNSGPYGSASKSGQTVTVTAKSNAAIYNVSVYMFYKP